MDDGARGAAGAEHDGRADVRVQPGAQLIEIGGKAVGIGVAAAEHAVLEPQRVDRADALGRLVAPVDRGEGRFLVRDRDIAAGKAHSAQG